MRRRHALTLGIVGLTLLLGGERSSAGPPDPTRSDQLGNTAGGTAALSHNTTGKDNTAFGDKALSSNTTGLFNTATGFQALSSNVTGGDNTAIGIDALSSNSIGDNNTAVGSFALSHNTTGNANTASGGGALVSNTTGDDNTATGGDALQHNTTGAFNTATGLNALLNNTEGNFNTALGFRTLQIITSGDNNTAIGVQAGIGLQNGSNNIYLGNLGPRSSGNESNTMRLGEPQIQTSTFIAGIAGAAVANGASVLINTATGQLGTLNSSARYKSDIEPMGAHSRGLFQLRPVTFRYNEDVQGERQYGLIAEQVAKVYPELVTRNAAGEIESVRYHELVPMLLNEVQQQQRQLASMKAQLHERDAVVAARLARLEAAASQTSTLASR